MTVNWSVVAVVMSAVALIVSSLILQGQTNGRIDAVRTEVLTRIDAVDQRFDAVDQRFDTVDQRFDTMNARIDAVDERFDTMNARIDATRTEVLAEVRALRDRLAPPEDGYLSAIHSDLAAIKQLLEQNITGANVQ